MTAPDQATYIGTSVPDWAANRLSRWRAVMQIEMPLIMVLRTEHAGYPCVPTYRHTYRHTCESHSVSPSPTEKGSTASKKSKRSQHPARPVRALLVSNRINKVLPEGALTQPFRHSFNQPTVSTYITHLSIDLYAALL